MEKHGYIDSNGEHKIIYGILDQLSRLSTYVTQ